MWLFDTSRPYEGQPHTFTGERGKQLLTLPDLTRSSSLRAITLRDVYDSTLIGMLRAYGISQARIDELQDMNEVYELLDFNGSSFDPVAAAQNVCCSIEERLGIYPNLPRSTETGRVRLS